MSQRYEIGETVTFRHRGTTQHGVIVGVELVDNPYLGRPGWHYLCRTADGLTCDCHESQIGGLVTGSPCVAYMSHVMGEYHPV